MEAAATSTRPTRRTRDPKVPQKLVEAAARAVAERGISGATVRAIATEAGVSTGSITHYFASKGELVSAVLAQANLNAGRRVAREVAGKQGLDAVTAALEAVLPLDAERRRDWRVWVSVWSEAASEPEAAGGLRQGWAALRGMIEPLLAQAADAGQIRSGLDLAYEADRLVTIAAGLGLAAAVEPWSRTQSRGRSAIADHLESLEPTGDR